MIITEEKNRCKLYNLIMSFAECDLSIAGAALNGCASLIECEEGMRDFLLADYGVRKTKKLETDIERLRETLNEKSISAYTAGKCMDELLPVLEELYEEDNEYERTVKRYSEYTSLYRIYQDAVNGMDRRMFRLFTGSAHNYDIGKYRRMLTNGRISFSEATTGKASEEITFDFELFDQDEINEILSGIMEEDAGNTTENEEVEAMKKTGDETSGDE